MIRISTLALAMLSAVTFAGVLSAQQVGDDAPDFTFDKSWNVPEDVDELKDLRGKIVMIDRWATW